MTWALSLTASSSGAHPLPGLLSEFPCSYLRDSSYSGNLLSLPLSTEWKEASSRQSYSQPFPSSKEKPAWTQSSISVCGNLLVAWPPCSGEGSLTRSCLFQPRKRLLGTRAGSSTELILRAHCFTQLLLAGYGP